MFDKEYLFRGSHAEKVIKLTSSFDNNKSKLFSRNIDVYIMAPIIGFLYKRKADIDRSTSEVTKIFAEQLSNERSTLLFIYRLIMLLDKEHEADFNERINKAFRYYDSEKAAVDEELFESYVRGGVDVLYEKLLGNITSEEDYLKNLYDFLEEFDELFNRTISTESILDLCRLARS